jgi:CheY-like chemotaxis protein
MYYTAIIERAIGIRIMIMKRALIVDDNYYNRDVAGLALKHAGYEVMEAEDGREALNILDKNNFDLLLLDLAMPEVSGMGVLQELRTQPQHKKMCVIIMTANPHMAMGEIDTMADFTMYKPIDVMEFTRFIQRL